MVLLISNDDVEKVLTIADCITSIEEGVKEYYRGDATCRPRIDVWAPCGEAKSYYQWGSMEGTSRHHMVFATRIKSDIAYWTEYNGVKTQEKYCQRRGKFCELVLLFSLENGEPLAIMNDGFIQHMRVGATAGLAAKYVAREDAETLGMIGSGGMARTHAIALCEVRKIRKIQVYSPTPRNREPYAREMSEKLGIDVIPVGRPQDAVKGAQIVATCTDSVVPVLSGEWLEEGVFLTTVKGTTEVDEEALKRVDIFFTFSPQTPLGTGDDKQTETPAHRISGTHRAYVAGTPEDLGKIPKIERTRRIDQRRVVSFKDVFEGKALGRVNEKQILGTAGNQIQGIQFASVGGLTYRLVKQRGLGREFPTDWLLQDIRN